jgi:hypothetical protein
MSISARRSLSALHFTNFEEGVHRPLSGDPLHGGSNVVGVNIPASFVRSSSCVPDLVRGSFDFVDFRDTRIPNPERTIIFNLDLVNLVDFKEGAAFVNILGQKAPPDRGASFWGKDEIRS